MFVNIGNRDWFYPDDTSTPPFTDSNIEIEGMTCDGNKNRQTVIYECQYMPNQTAMAPTVLEEHGTTPRISCEGRSSIDGRSGTLAQGSYEVFIRYMDANGNEGISAAYGINLTGIDPNTGLNKNSIQVYLPPVPPAEAVAVVPYIAAANGGSKMPDGPTNEINVYSQPRYQRLDPIYFEGNPHTRMWDGNPNADHWPYIAIFSRTGTPLTDGWPFRQAYRQGSIFYPYPAPGATYQVLYPDVHQPGNYPVPSRNGSPGDASLSAMGSFSYVSNLNIHNVEIRNFAVDGMNLYRIMNSQFNGLHVHHNGRYGIALTSSLFQNLNFNNCVIELNELGGFDAEPANGSGLFFTGCSFFNQAQLCALSQGNCANVQIHNCLFDGSYTFHIAVGLAMNITNLSIRNCTFLNNYARCLVFNSGNGKGKLSTSVLDTNYITGVISGCRFVEATGRVYQLGPLYASGSALDTTIIDIQGIGVGLTIGGATFFDTNFFEPWFFFSPYLVPPVPFSRNAAIALGGANGDLPIGPTTIMNNQFQSNTRDTRPYPHPILGASYSPTNKDNQFITVSSPNLRLCTISGNFGDGIIYVMPAQIATYQSNPT
jgi:hypothetical protein